MRRARQSHMTKTGLTYVSCETDACALGNVWIGCPIVKITIISD